MPGIILRPERLEDAERALEWMNDPGSVRFLGSGFAKKRSLEDAREEIALRLDGEFTGETFAVADGETGEYLGRCDLLLPDPAAKKAEIAIVLVPSARGRGIAASALKLLCAHAFEEGYERLYLKCASLNTPAVRLYERAGFAREGTLRRHLMTPEGLCDVYVYGLLRTEFSSNGE